MHRGCRLPVTCGGECAAPLRRCTFSFGLAARNVARGECARGIVHQPLDAYQNVGAPSGQNRGTLWYFAPTLRFRQTICHRWCLRADAGDALELDTLMRIGHNVVPRLRREGAASYTMARCVVAVAEASPSDGVAG